MPGYFGQEYFGEDLGAIPSVIVVPTTTSTPSRIICAWAYGGTNAVPQDVRRRRKQVTDMMLRLGTPVLIKKLYTVDDVDQGIAQTSPNFSRTYGQTRHNDPFSHGAGFCSVEVSTNEWISPDGSLVISAINPGPGYLPAPKYRGYGPGYLTYVIEPDATLDTYKLTPTGALIKTEDATGQAPWYPTMHDNDLLINVTLDSEGNIQSTQERYQLKMVSPISFRGTNRRGRNETDNWQGKRGDAIGGNRFVVNQSFQMNLVPPNDDAVYGVDVDR